ncbi:MAG: Ig-like domain-containing protein [Spirochaetales bacterium]|nr:Ig-like domain-containing protein [Spirochaetales bacterium]
MIDKVFIFLFLFILATGLVSCNFLPMDQLEWERIKPGYPRGIILSDTEIQINLDVTAQLTAKVISDSPEYREVLWSSSDPGIAIVDADGLVQPITPGTTLITGTTRYGRYTDTCFVLVKPIGTVTGLTLDPAELTLDLCGISHPSFANLTAFFSPSNATDKSVFWDSENRSVAAVSSAGLVTSLAAGTTRIKATSRADSSFFAYCTVTVIMSPSPYKRRYTLNVGQVVTAEYSRAIDRIVIISSLDNELSLIDPENGNSAATSLPYAPLSIGLAPDGLAAAVGYTNFVGTVDLGTGIPVVTHTWPITPYTGYGINRGNITSIMLDPIGYIYGIDGADQWIDLRQIDSNTGTEVLKGVSLLYAGSKGRMHKDGTSIYYTDSSWICNINISDPGATVFPYYYNWEYGSGLFWFFDTGKAIINSRGNVCSITQVKATDFGDLGTVVIPFGGNGLHWADHNSMAVHDSVTGLIAAIPFSWDDEYDADHFIYLINAATYGMEGSFLLPDFLVDSIRYPGHGRFCFWNNAGTELYVLIQSTGAPNPNLWELVVY